METLSLLSFASPQYGASKRHILEPENYMNLTTYQRDVIQGMERMGASLSLVGVCFIFAAFAAFERLRSVPNTFILFASIANVGASIACLIGYAGVEAGVKSNLCQAQAFLLEMFMQSDPWWSLAMAVNVFLVFFRSCSPYSFRHYLWVYCLVCFGVPLVAAIVCLIVAKKRPEPIYGNATLWCWIGDGYNSLRIYTYYMPIWGCILLSAVIYIAVGWQVFRQRNKLRNLTLSTQAKNQEGTVTELSDLPSPGERGTDKPYSTITTEVQVKSEHSSMKDSTSRSHTPDPHVTLPETSHPGCMIHYHERDPWADDVATAATVRTTIVQTGESASPSAIPSTFTHAMDMEAAGTIITRFKVTSTTSPAVLDSATSMTSIPSNTSHPNHLTRTLSPMIHPVRFLSAKIHRLDPVKLAYMRTSFVFAISVLVTWTPSSVNRVYTLAHPTSANYRLNLASACVLPLQGLWNAVIFTATSQLALREEFAASWWRFKVRSGWWGELSSRRKTVCTGKERVRMRAERASRGSTLRVPKGTTTFGEGITS